jgi:hypothetical protein
MMIPITFQAARLGCPHGQAMTGCNPIAASNLERVLISVKRKRLAIADFLGVLANYPNVVMRVLHFDNIFGSV